MDKTSCLSFRIDSRTKEVAETLFANLGITVGEAVNIFLKQSLVSGGLPFKYEI